ncbi:glycosyltransferase family 2 protein [Winogradskyella schleiferi]|uniref:glycosyltransferase family 2 protein n=1 Tax=Winogradskyella schleiferi TaxID=2686078 RepID=UPI0015BBE890|nr:glycosyltransferase family 2 protein [Winogradskyella schleiferi]
MISVVALTYNDEDIIADFIANCQFANEIIVLDNHSNDATIQIAKSKSAFVFSGDFMDFEIVKPFALSKASHPWILCLKPNERISEALSNEIIDIVDSNSNGNYSIKSKLSFMGKVLKHADSTRILKDRLNHVGDTSTKTKTLKNPIITDYICFDRFNATLTKQAKNEANTLAQKNLRPNLYHFLIKPFGSLMKHYVFKLGFLDGKEGFIYSYLQAFKVFKRYLYLWLHYRNLR